MSGERDDPFSERTALLIGRDGLARLRASHVAVVGVGGVGGHVAEALARAGVGRLTLVDPDRVEPSNLNRQLVALRSTLGQPKVAALAERIADINPACQVEARQEFLIAEAVADFLAEPFDQVVDAIDSLTSKVALLEQALGAGRPIVSSMGAGGRLDPTRLRVGDLMDTSMCRLARAVRTRLRQRGIGRGLTVVWSDEPPRPPLAVPGLRAVNGTISYLPALFGLTLAGLVVQRLIAPEPVALTRP